MTNMVRSTSSGQALSFLLKVTHQQELHSRIWKFSQYGQKYQCLC
ncbi:hypothetical protein Nmel_000433, partial [Mimus melanotis]